jgi:hypothetical protein
MGQGRKKKQGVSHPAGQDREAGQHLARVAVSTWLVSLAELRSGFNKQGNSIEGG